MSEQRRQELLSLTLDWAREHGLHALSLRPLASVIGTSPRMLLYHFESKEGLIRALLEEVAQQWIGSLHQSLTPQADLTRTLETLWRKNLRMEENRSLHGLALEAWAIGIRSRKPAQVSTSS